jgi:serine/threonine protein kinase
MKRSLSCAHKCAYSCIRIYSHSNSLLFSLSFLLYLYYRLLYSISIRGWSHDGIESFRTGRNCDYFLVLDLLPELLEHRIYYWRQLIRKYRHRMRLLPWSRVKFLTKIHGIFVARLQVAHDIASGIEYMHNRRIINRDIKMYNIGFHSDGAVQLFDFGLSRLLPSENERVEGGFVMSRVGTKHYMAPEVRNKQPYDLSADVYSFGVLIWELLSLSSARDVLRNHNTKSDRQDGCPLPMCPCWPEGVSRLIYACVSDDPSKRPLMTEVRSTLWSQMARLGALVPDEKRLLQKRRSTLRIDLTEMEDLRTVVCESVCIGDASMSVLSSLDDTSLTGRL